MGADEVMKFMVEKLKEFLLILENLDGEALAWFDNIFPPKTRANKINHWIHIALPYLIPIVVLTAIVCCCHCCFGCFCGRGKGKMMKAPGRNCRMHREVFESDPKGYFLNLCAHPGDELC